MSPKRLPHRTWMLLLGLAAHAAAGGTMAFPGKDWAEAAPQTRGIDQEKLGEALVAPKQKGEPPRSATTFSAEK